MADLKLGASGSGVKKLQELLIALNAKPKVKATSKFDETTEEALIFIQKKLKLKADGIAKSATITALEEEVGKGETAGLEMTVRDYTYYIKRNDEVRRHNTGEYKRHLARLETIIRRSRELGPDAIKKLNEKNEKLAADAKRKADREAKTQPSTTTGTKDKGTPEKQSKTTTTSSISTQVKSPDEYIKLKAVYMKYDEHCNKQYKRWLTFAHGIKQEQEKFETFKAKGDTAGAEQSLKLVKSQDTAARKMIDEWADSVAKKVAIDKRIEETETAIKTAMADIASQS